MTKKQIDVILDEARHWPPEDREELAEFAREIEARRSGVYVLDEDERRAIEEAKKSGLATEADVRTQRSKFALRDMAFKGKGLRPEIADAGWGRIRNLAYDEPQD
ncbi:MAG: hypothetical protein AB7K64_08935 [Variibacter sp.]